MMPRQPSPASAYAAPPPFPIPSISANYERKQKLRNIMGITAGAEDVKYQAKYRDLKKKVKEIESDNDRLYFKLLLAKKNIRRMNLERAILYERLAAVPPTPGRTTQELPTEQDPIFHSQPPAPPEHARVIDPNDRELSEWIRTHPTARMIQGPDGTVVAIEDTPASVDARGIPVHSGPPPPHGLSLVPGFRHDSGPGHDSSQLEPRAQPPMIPLLQHAQSSTPELSMTNEHHVNQYTYPQSRPPPPQNSHSHSNSSHHSRSSSARPDLEPTVGGNSRVETQGVQYAPHTRSPNIQAESHPEHRSRRHETLEHSHGHQLPHPHIDIPPPNLPGSPPMLSPTSHHRGSRVHNHQRMGPGANIHRERDPERDWELQQQLEYNRQLEREREAQREIELRHRLALEEQEEEALWAEEEARARALSRSGSPGSTARAGGSRDASVSAGAGQAYEHDRAPPRMHPAPHVSNLLGIEREPGFKEDERNVPHDRLPGAESSRAASALEQRKRSRDEMEVDDRFESEGRPANEGGSSARASANFAGNRGGKRTHAEEDGDAGQPTSGKGDAMPDDRMDDD